MMRGQQFFEGMDPPAKPARPKMTSAVFNTYSGEHRALESQGARQVIKGSGWPQKKPVGMRGSLVDRAKLATRLDHKTANEGRWQSLRDRMQAEDGDENYDDDPPEPHPRTGLPSHGQAQTYGREPYHNETDMPPSIGFEEGYVPQGFGFHDSSSSARKSVGSREWVPNPGMRTVQATVSLGRVHEIVDNPKTSQTPRIPTEVGRPDLPHVYEDLAPPPHTQHPSTRIYTMIDGNHRMSADMLNGRLFSEAYVLRHNDLPLLQNKTRQISQAKTAATRNPKVDADAVERRMNRNVYGEDDY